MKHNSRSASHASPPVGFASENLKSIEETLALLLASTPFKLSEQCRDFLTYVVRHSLSGDEESLRERVIGVMVFGRRSDYDTADDPVVRVRAADVRKRLAQYYQSPESAASALRIDIPTGSYRAHFESKTPQNVIELPPTAALPPAEPLLEPAAAALSAIPAIPAIPAAPAHPAQGVSHRILASAAALLLLAFLIVGWWLVHPRPDTAINLFWNPILKSPKPVLICAGTGTVYSMSSNFQSQKQGLKADKDGSELNEDQFVNFAPDDVIHTSDLVPRKDIYVSIGTVYGSIDMVSYLVRNNKAYDLRYGNDLAFGDLHHSPAVLLGGFNNPWSLKMTNSLRFVLHSDRSIEDRQKGPRAWSVNENFSTDYGIVTRLLDADTGSPLIVGAGIGQAGTRAAGAFLADPQAMAAFAAQAPKDWDRKNLQIVLQVKVINNTPSNPKIVATYFW
jgi:hypothetical protein